MTQYSLQARDPIFVKGYGLLSYKYKPKTLVKAQTVQIARNF